MHRDPQSRNVVIERLDPFGDDAWDARVMDREDHSVFHRSAWARILAETYGHRPFYLRVLVSGVEAALVPLLEVRSPFTGSRAVSLPFSDFAGPLWIDDSQAAAVHAGLRDLAAREGWRHLEIRGNAVPPMDAKPFQSYETHALDLRPGLVEVERGFHPAVRQALRKAHRSGLDVTLETGPAGIDAFYALHCRTRRRHGLPPQSKRFFKALERNLFSHGLGHIMLASYANTVVAGAVFLRSEGNSIYKFGASDPAFWHLRPNQLVMWHGIRHLIGLGCRTLNFGRTAKSDEGLRRFKLSWGSVAKPLRYFRYCPGTGAWISADGEHREAYPIIFGHLPVALNRVLGGLIYPHLD